MTNVLLFFLKNYFFFFLLTVVLAYLLTTYSKKFSSKLAISLLFLAGLCIAPVGSGAIFYPQSYSIPLIDFTIPFITIPAVIATSIYIRTAQPIPGYIRIAEPELEKIKIALLFLWIIIAVALGLFYAMPFGWHLPEPLIELEINKGTMIASSLIHYLKHVIPPAFLCFFYAKLEQRPLSIVLLLLIPAVIGFLHRLTAILTGGAI